VKAKVSLADELAFVRGMSEPFFFRANIIKPGNKVLIHAVVFTSFEVPGKGEEDITICSDDRDPRMRAFVEFVWTNFLKERGAELVATMRRIEEKDADLAQIKKDLEALQKKHEL